MAAHVFDCLHLQRICWQVKKQGHIFVGGKNQKDFVFNFPSLLPREGRWLSRNGRCVVRHGWSLRASMYSHVSKCATNFLHLLIVEIGSSLFGQSVTFFVTTIERLTIYYYAYFPLVRFYSSENILWRKYYINSVMSSLKNKNFASSLILHYNKFLTCFLHIAKSIFRLPHKWKSSYTFLQINENENYKF